MDEVQVPPYFICPISLQIMKDPVTTISGITYDRESIEHWLSTAANDVVTTAACPVTKQPMPRDSDLIPNHTLRRLIQSWCVLNANNGVDRIPTPKSPTKKSNIVKLIRNLNIPEFHSQALKKMEEIAEESEKSRACMVEAGVVRAMVFWIIRRFKEGKFDTTVTESLKLLRSIWISTEEADEVVELEKVDLIDSLGWILSLEIKKPTHHELAREIARDPLAIRSSGAPCISPGPPPAVSAIPGNVMDKVSVHSRMEEKENKASTKTNALLVLRRVFEVTSSNLLEQLKLDFFDTIVGVWREKNTITLCPQATKAALHVLIEVCPFGRNRFKIVECGAVFDLIELELKKPEKSLTELIFCLLAQLCTCAEGREQFLRHAGSIAMVAKRILRVSPATDDRAVHILSLVGRFCATDEVVVEMLRVGAVSKLCTVVQADSDPRLKRRAREVLRLHSKVWNNSPCMRFTS